MFKFLIMKSNIKKYIFNLRSLTYLLLLFTAILFVECNKKTPKPIIAGTTAKFVVNGLYDYYAMAYVEIQVFGISGTCTEGFKWPTGGSMKGYLSDCDPGSSTQGSCPQNSEFQIQVPIYGDYEVHYLVRSGECNNTFSTCKDKNGANIGCITAYQAVTSTVDYGSADVCGNKTAQDPYPVYINAGNGTQKYARCCCIATDPVNMCASGKSCVPVSFQNNSMAYTGVCGAYSDATGDYSCPVGETSDVYNNCGPNCDITTTCASHGLTTGWSCNMNSGMAYGICQKSCTTNSDCTGAAAGKGCNNGWCR
jgi:hypothetical protein